MSEKADQVLEHARSELASGNTHECFVPSCKRQIPISFLMCSPHWSRVPKDLQREVWKHFRDGQQFGEVELTDEYIAAARKAAEYVEKICYPTGSLF